MTKVATRKERVSFSSNALDFVMRHPIGKCQKFATVYRSVENSSLDDMRLVTLQFEGAQWLSGRVLDSRPKGPRVRASPASLPCVLEQEH